MKKRGIQRQVVGTVVSDKMDKSAVVLVNRLVKHRLYKKHIRRRSRFAVHDERNACHIGDTVLITESKPISKSKKWHLSKIVKKAV